MNVLIPSGWVQINADDFDMLLKAEDYRIERYANGSEYLLLPDKVQFAIATFPGYACFVDPEFLTSRGIKK